MNRRLTALLVLVSIPFIQTAASAKGTVSSPANVKKMPAAVKSEVRANEAKMEPTQAVVRTQSAVVPREDEDLSSFTPPEGALYTTSDECA